MDIYQQLMAQIKLANPSTNLALSDICALDQDLAYLNEIHSRLLNPAEGLSLVDSSKQVFNIASRWLGGSDSLFSWLQAYIRVNEA